MVGSTYKLCMTSYLLEKRDMWLGQYMGYDVIFTRERRYMVRPTRSSLEWNSKSLLPKCKTMSRPQRKLFNRESYRLSNTMKAT